VFGQEVISITCIGNGDITREYYPGSNFKIVGKSKIIQNITFSDDMIKSISSEIIGNNEPKVEETLYITKQDNKLHIPDKEDRLYQHLTNQVTNTKIEFYTYIHTDIKKTFRTTSYIQTEIDRTTGLFAVQINVSRKNWLDVKIKDNSIVLGNIYDARGECKKTTKNKF